jgi:hypothetical protein
MVRGIAACESRLLKCHESLMGFEVVEITEDFIGYCNPVDCSMSPCVVFATVGPVGAQFSESHGKTSVAVSHV